MRFRFRMSMRSPLWAAAGEGSWSRAGVVTRLAGLALAAAGVLLLPAPGAAAHPGASREMVPAEVERVVGLPVGGPDCSHARDMFVRGSGQHVPAIDTCGYYLDGPTHLSSSGVATVMRVTTADALALLPAMLPGAAPAPDAGVGDWAYWRADTSAAGLVRVALVTGTASELIATEVVWTRNHRDVPVSLALATELTRITLTP